mmetsp:Transcript_55836/g.109301  ORF Transcript_55836/g.109301 Transcript_55836/m.109301 type:complete len:82 (+) Transcript_55836:1195-1440(+)
MYDSFDLPSTFHADRYERRNEEGKEKGLQVHDPGRRRRREEERTQSLAHDILRSEKRERKRVSPNLTGLPPPSSPPICLPN